MGERGLCTEGARTSPKGEVRESKHAVEPGANRTGLCGRPHGRHGCCLILDYIARCAYMTLCARTTGMNRSAGRVAFHISMNSISTPSLNWRLDGSITFYQHCCVNREIPSIRRRSDRQTFIRSHWWVNPLLQLHKSRDVVDQHHHSLFFSLRVNIVITKNDIRMMQTESRLAP
jgi:hypothetical protein